MPSTTTTLAMSLLKSRLVRPAALLCLYSLYLVPEGLRFRNCRITNQWLTGALLIISDTVSVLSHLQKETPDESSLPTLDSITPKIREEQATSRPQPKTDAAPLEGGMDAQALEEEAGQEAAFNPETGEINWDCPCLGGMAHGPCGEEFKAAFSCFVYSKEEPKGIECIEKFKYVDMRVILIGKAREFY